MIKLINFSYDLYFGILSRDLLTQISTLFLIGVRVNKINLNLIFQLKKAAKLVWRIQGERGIRKP